MKIAVLGSGAWGTALALVASRAGHEVMIWSRNVSLQNQLNAQHENCDYLPGIALPQAISAKSSLAESIEQDILILAVPAQSIRQLCINLSQLNLSPKVILLISSKGIEQDTLKLMSEVTQEILPNNRVAILSGPNFAREVALDLPTITAIAAADLNLSNFLSEALSQQNFRIYPNNDIIGTQIFGAAKNVLAIATGVTIGKELGENAKASIVSRGINEINALSLAMGGKINTILSPAGIGDIHLTCSSATSRNTSLGIALAKGEMASSSLAEGFYSANSINSLAKKFDIEMPICQSVYKIIYQHLSPDQAIKELLQRSIKK